MRSATRRTSRCLRLIQLGEGDSGAVAALEAHYADAIPLDLLKTEQARITAAITAAQARLDSLQHDVEAAQANLHKALSLVQDCETAYREAPAAASPTVQSSLLQPGPHR